jgi:hypothetical protein
MVIAFALTMFSGTFYFKDLLFKPKKVNREQDMTNEIASIGSVIVNKDIYNNILNKTVYNNYNVTKTNLEPDQLESLKLQAFLKAAKDSLFLEEAKKNRLNITGADLKAAIQNILKTYNLKNIKELKQVLKTNQVPYSDFITSLKNELLAKKFENVILLNNVQVSNKDVENSQFELKIRHLFLKIANSESDKETLAKIKEIKIQINQGLSMTEAIKKYSQDTKHKDGDLGWISVNETPLNIEMRLII